MARVKGGPKQTHRKKILKLAKGYFGSRHRLYRTANESVMRAWAYAYRDRRNIKRDFRKLWITRINAAANLNGISYSKFMYGLKIEGIEINRKMLSEIAIHDPKAFTGLVRTAQAALTSGRKPAEKVAPVKVAKVKDAPLPEVVVTEVDSGVEISLKKTTKKAKKVEEVVVETEKPVTKKATVKKAEVKEESVQEVVVEKKPAAKKSKVTEEATETKKAPAKKSVKVTEETVDKPKRKPASKSKKEAE